MNVNIPLKIWLNRNDFFVRMFSVETTGFEKEHRLEYHELILTTRRYWK